MPQVHEIRANYDETTLIVYQAYPAAIAEAALRAGKFVPPFSLNRMTWIKPSFLWMMERSNWGLKAGQERILSVRITRSGWEEALSLAVLTHPEKSVYPDPDEWRRQMDKALVTIQWDPERDLRGTPQDYQSIQVGISRHVAERYVDAWTTEIQDVTPLVRKMHQLIQSGQAAKAKHFLPGERVYPVNTAVAKRLGMSS